MSEGNGNGTPPAGRDDGADRDTRPSKPCCKRLTVALPTGGSGYGFCHLPDGHDRGATATSCEADISAAPAPTDFGPRHQKLKGK